MKVNKIAIIGGGSSGWLTAAFLKKTFPQKEITVVESPKIPIVGVGESTLADMTNFRDYLGIDEKDFMPACNASYKMSIKFTDFYKKDSGGFHYPFREPDFNNSVNGLYDWFDMKAYNPELPVQDFIRCYFPHAALFEQNKISDNNYGLFDSYNKKTDVAYHFDSVLFGQWLKDSYCIPKGVKYISAEVKDATVNDDGIESLFLDNDTQIKSDLFIDCTGFKSLLLGNYLGEKFESYNDMLPNNRAWATQLPYKNKEQELEPFTNSTAIGNGWVWNIPLWSRIGTGYVYSDKHISSEDALKEFKEHLKSDKMINPRTDEDIDKLTFKDIKMRVGIHERLFVKNVCAIGLSAGFIEPLESNGLFTVQGFARILAKTLLRDEISQWDRDVFNNTTRGMFDNFAEFVGMHYSLSHRDDTQYWKDIKKKHFSQQLLDRIPTSKIGYWQIAQRKMFGHAIEPGIGETYISVGMNYLVRDIVDEQWNSFGFSINKSNHIANLENIYNDKKARWQAAAENSPTLYEYLRKNIFKEY